MPPPVPPPGFRLDAPTRSGPPAPPAGFTLDTPTPAAAAIPSLADTFDAGAYDRATDFGRTVIDAANSGNVYGRDWLRGQLEVAAGRPPPPPPGFALDQPPEWIDVPEDEPLGFGDVLGDSLSQTASEWGDVLGGLPTKVSASLAKMIASQQASTFAELEQANAAAAALPADDWRRWFLTPGQGTPEKAAELRDLTETELAIAREANVDLAPTEGATMLQSAVESAAVSAPPSAIAMATGLLTRSPAAAAASMYPTTAAQGFGDMLEQLEAQDAQTAAETLTPATPEDRLENIARAQRYGEREGVIESATEFLPMGALLKKGSPAVQKLAEVLLAELPGETLATLTQEINRQIALQPEGEATLDAVFAGLEEGGKQIPETLLASIVGSAGQTAPIVAGEAIANRLATPREGKFAPEYSVDAKTGERVEPTLGDEIDVEAAPARGRVEPTLEQPPKPPEGFTLDAPLDVEGMAGIPAEGPPEAARAPEARMPSEAWRADTAAGEGVPFAFLGETPEEAAGYLVEQNGKIDAFTAAGELIGSFDGPDQAAIALEDAVGVQTPTPAQGFGDELTEIGGAPVPKEATAGQVVEKGFGDVLAPPAAETAAYNAPGDEIAGGAATPGRQETPIGQPAGSQAGQQRIPVPVEERERRANRQTPAKRVEEMTPAELRQTLLTHELTGIPNRRAYNEAPKRATQTAVDVDSLKWINDNMGHDSGNELLKAVGEAIRAETDEAYHLSGDEFAIQADTPEAAAEIMERVNERLAGAVISVTMPDGDVVTVSGLGVSYGSGKNLSEADAALQSHKTERETRGQRSGRGVAPPGASRFAAGEGRQGDEGDAAAGAETVEAGERGAPQPAAEESTAGEHVTLAGPFAQREQGTVDDVELADDSDRPRGRRGGAIERWKRETEGQSTQAREVAVLQMLGGAKNAPRARFVRGNGLPHSVQKRMHVSPGNTWHAAFDPATNAVYINQDVVTTEAAAQWYAAHEIAGHYGIRGFVGLMAPDARARVDRMLEQAAQNPTVQAVATALRKNRRAVSPLQSIEEALAELAAAARTGNYERIKGAYGVEVSAELQGKVKRAIDRFIERLKALFDKLRGKQKAVPSFTDEQVRRILEGAWRYVQEGDARKRSTPAASEEIVALQDEADELNGDVEAILAGDTKPVAAKFDSMIGKVIDLIDRIDGKKLDPGFGPMAKDLREAAMTNLEQLLDDYAERFGEQYDGRHAVEANKLQLANDDELAARAPPARFGDEREIGDSEINELLEKDERYRDRKGKPESADARMKRRLEELDEDPQLGEEKQTDTPAFKKWFGDSKVVDENGAPLVVYHGSTAVSRIRGMKPGKNRWNGRDLGVHFGSSAAANERLVDVRQGPGRRTGAPGLVPVYLSIKNPIELEDVGNWRDAHEIAIAAAEVSAELSNKIIEAIEPWSKQEDETGRMEAVRKVLQDAGYDGVSYRNGYEVKGTADVRHKIKRLEARIRDVTARDESNSLINELEGELFDLRDDLEAMLKEADERSWIAFEPGQIKSAVGNRGTFDASDPDIVREGVDVDFEPRPGNGKPERRARRARSRPLLQGEQGELFTKEDARPGTTPKQLELANELLREWADKAAKGAKAIRTLAVAFNKDFRADHTASLLGRNLTDPHDFALLAQTFRDPRYETLRYFFTDAKGKVIAETGVSARLPGGASAWPAGATEQWLVDMFKRVGAKGLQLLHNHPSGIAQSSYSDDNITQKIAQLLKIPVQHVIVDSNEYAVLTVDEKGGFNARQRVKLKGLGPDKMLKPRGQRKLRKILGSQIVGPYEMVRVAQQLENKDGYYSVIGLSARHDVRAIGDLRITAIKNGGELELALHDFGLQNGSPALVLAGLRRDEFDHPSNRKAFANLIRDGYLLDVIDRDGRSLQNTTVVGRGERTLGKLEALDSTEIGSGKPFGEGGRREDRRKTSVPVPASTSRSQLDLFDQQRAIDELIDPDLTETSAFKRWFGKSKVVDDKGKPLVMYHGTQAKTDFAAFEETSDIGFHFGTVKAATDRVHFEKSKRPMPKNARIIPVYLSIKNPLRLPDLYEWSTYELVPELHKAGVITSAYAKQLIDDATKGVAAGDMAQLDAAEFRRLLEAKGYDGVVYKNEAEGIEREPFPFTIDDVEIRHDKKKAHPYVAYTPEGKYLTSASSEQMVLELVEDLLELGDVVERDSWIALRPQQIKSAIGNRGTFSEEAEEIHLAEEPTDETEASTAKGGVQKISWQPGQNYVDMYRSKGAPTQRQPATTMGTGTRADVIDIPEEPIRAQHVMELFQRLFKVKIYEGKPFAVRGALGFFRPSNFEVRNKNRNDLEVAAHEVFHWLDRTYPEIRALYHKRRYADELKGVSYDVTKIFEGFAEFGRLFMTQETEAITRLPQFYEAFVKAARDNGILDKLEEVQRLMHQWYLQGAEHRGRSKIGTSAAPLKQRLGKMADGFIDRAIASSLDQLQAAKVIERETRGDIAADAADSPYKSMRLLQGARSTINAWLNHGTLKWGERGDLEFNGLGLRQIFEPVAGVFDEAMGYFVAMRADELRKYGKENLFSRDETAALIERARKTGKLEQIRHAHEQYQQFTKRLTAFAVQSGILSAETKAVWEELYSSYVPFYRVAEKFGSLDPRFTGGTKGGLFRKLYGGTANVADVFENITLNTALIVHASLKNVAKRQLFASIESSPVGQRYAVRIPESTEQRKVGIAQVERVLKEFAREAADKYHSTPEADQATRIEFGQMAMLAKRLASRDPEAGQLTMADVMTQARFFFTGNPPTIPDKEMVLVKGEPRWFQIGDPMLWDMLTAINYHQPIGLTEKILGLAKRTLTRGVTVTPEFQIANILRDTFNAFAMSKGKQWPIVDALKAMRDIWSESPAYKEFLANGGGFGNAIGDEAKRLRVQMKATGTRRLIAMPAELIDYWDKWGQSFELATRLAEFKKIRGQGATRREAAYQGREISTDFAMRGHSALARWASISLAFFNARLQGLYRIEREINEKRGRQSPLRGERAIAYATRALTGLTLPSLLVYWFLNRGDDDYEELGEELKSLNTVIPGPDGTQLLIPRPFETGALFQEIPIRLLELYRERDGDKAVNAMMFMLANTFNFSPIPQAAAPPATLATNTQWNGLPVIPRNLQNVEPREQFQPWTPDTYKKVGEWFDVSPLKLQALVEGYFGTIGAYAIAASDALLTPTDTTGDEPSRRLQQYPLFRRFMRQQPYTNTSFEQRFYDLLDETTRVVDTARKMRREARVDDLEDYLGNDELAALFAVSGPTTDVMEQAADLNAQMRKIRNDGVLSAAEKRRQIDELQAEQNALFKAAVEAFDEALLEEARRALGGQ